MVFYPLDHGLLRTDFGRTNGAGRLDVDDGAERHVDEIAVGISEECRSLLRPDLLRCRIEWRDKSKVNPTDAGGGAILHLPGLGDTITARNDSGG
jgi:hypothetical protein